MLEEVGTVRSLLDLIEIAQMDGVLCLDPYVELASATLERRAMLTAAMDADDTVRGLPRSDERDHMALTVTIQPDSLRSSEAGPLVMAEVVRILEKEGFTECPTRPQTLSVRSRVP